MSQSHAVNPVGFPPLRFRATVSALRKTSGITTALPRFSTTPPSSSAGNDAASRLKSRWLVAPRAAPSAVGCWWMMSAPTAACTVTGTPRSRAASRSDASGATSPERRRSASTSASPMPRPARAPPGAPPPARPWRRARPAASPKKSRNSGPCRAVGRARSDRLCSGVARWERSSVAKSPPRRSRSWMLGRGGVVLLELQRHLAEGEVRLQREHDARLLVGEPHPGVGLLGEDTAAVRDARTDHDRVPLPARDAHAVALQYLDDDRIALGPEVALVLVALADLERHGADPVEERGIVERLGDRRCRAVAPRLAVHPGVGVDLELPLPRLALLLGLIQKPARPKIAPPHPRLEVLMNVVPQRTTVDQKPEVHGLHGADRIDARDLHGGRADAERPVPRAIHQALAHGKRHRGWGRGGRTRRHRHRP